MSDIVYCEELVLRVRAPRRVFKPRIWIGMFFCRLGFKIMGANAEASQF
jgi:hypothetical protein